MHVCHCDVYNSGFACKTWFTWDERACYVPIYDIAVKRTAIPLSSASAVPFRRHFRPLMRKLHKRCQSLTLKSHPLPRRQALTRWLRLKYFSASFFFPLLFHPARPLRPRFRALSMATECKFVRVHRPASLLLLIDWLPLASRHWCIRAINFIACHAQRYLHVINVRTFRFFGSKTDLLRKIGLSARSYVSRYVSLLSFSFFSFDECVHWPSRWPRWYNKMRHAIFPLPYF